MKKKRVRPVAGKREAAGRKNQPIDRKEAVQQSNDERIDQDFPGYPHHPAKEETIHNGSADAFQSAEGIPIDEDDEEEQRQDNNY
ncbi:MAG: hypothetical protein JST42_20690 [Bacteroidetes bacterium]|nr:hypothetical protein [Bacteroidota bacterium]